MSFDTEVREAAQDETDRRLRDWVDRQRGQAAEDICRSFEIEWDGDMDLVDAQKISAGAALDVTWCWAK